MPRELEGEDLRVANAIKSACFGIGYALFVTIREATRPFGSPGHDVDNAVAAVSDAWDKAADKLIDVVMEAD